MGLLRKTRAPQSRRPVRVAGTRVRRGVDPSDQPAVGEQASGVEDQYAGEGENQKETFRLSHLTRWLRPTVMLTISALLLAALGTWFTIEYGNAMGGGTGDNLAMVDSAATAEVKGQVQRGLERTFSYRYRDPDASERASEEVFVEKAIQQYDRLFASVRKQAPQQQLEISSKATFSGVKLLDGDRAALLVFLDQSATRGDTQQSSTGGAQLRVTAKRVDDQWRISDLRAY